MRVLVLEGSQGCVGCRVHEQWSARTLPSRSPTGVTELATRTLLRMNNLAVVRGPPGASMFGPTDYYANLEAAHLWSFSMFIDGRGLPNVLKRKRPRLPTPAGVLRRGGPARHVGDWCTCP